MSNKDNLFLQIEYSVSMPGLNFLTCISHTILANSISDYIFKCWLTFQLYHLNKHYKVRLFINGIIFEANSIVLYILSHSLAVTNSIETELVGI